MARRVFVAPSPIEAAKDVDDLAIRDVSLNVYLIDAIEDAMKAEGYGRRSRSRWLEEALAGMMVDDPLMIEGSTGDKAVAGDLGKLTRLKVQLSRPMARQLDALAARLRTHNPFTVGPMSYAVRSAARFRLRFPEKFRYDTTARSDLLSKACEVDFSA